MTKLLFLLKYIENYLYNYKLWKRYWPTSISRSWSWKKSFGSATLFQSFGFTHFFLLWLQNLGKNKGIFAWDFFRPLVLFSYINPMPYGLVHVHGNAACPCSWQCCVSMFMTMMRVHVHDNDACPCSCQCCVSISMSMLHVHVLLTNLFYFTSILKPLS